MQVATTAGEVVEVRYNPGAATLQVRLALPGQIRDVSGFLSAHDGARHPMCLLETGDVKQIFFHI